MARDGRRDRDRKNSFFIIDKSEKDGSKKDGNENKSSVGENIADIVKNFREEDGGKEKSPAGGRGEASGSSGAESRQSETAENSACAGKPQQGSKAPASDSDSTGGLYNNVQMSDSTAKGAGAGGDRCSGKSVCSDACSNRSACSDKCACPGKPEGSDKPDSPGKSSKSEGQELEKEAFGGTGGAFFNTDKNKFAAASDESEIKEKKEEAFTGTGGAFFNNDKVQMGEEEPMDKKEAVEDKKKEAFTGTGGAFFNKDKLDEAGEKDKRTDKDVKEAKQEAFTGTGGAFFNKDKIPPAKEVEKESGDGDGRKPEEEGSGSILKSENETGSGDGDKHVKIEEDRNESIDIPRESNKSSFVPVAMANPCAGSKIHDYRSDDQVVAEGAFFKKRVIFACFWHQKYFVLLRDGTLVYHKCSGARYAKGKWNIKESTNYQKIYMPNAWCHPYRFTFDASGTELYFAYDSLEERDYWHDVLEGVSRQN